MKENISFIRNNIEGIREKIRRISLKCGRNPDEIKIIAVTKTVAPELIIEAVNANILDLGENRVQELCDKYDIIDRRCNWHLIGHLQTNKVKYIIDKVALIHSVDRVELVKEIQKRAENAGKVMHVLVQVNIAEEESKFGLRKDQVYDFLKNISTFKNIKVKGLMTIAPFVENPEEVRYVFRDLRKLLIDIQGENIDNIDMDYLSMGMSNDFEIAIEEGSNMIRVGTSVFGRRQQGI